MKSRSLLLAAILFTAPVFANTETPVNPTSTELSEEAAKAAKAAQEAADKAAAEAAKAAEQAKAKEDSAKPADQTEGKENQAPAAVDKTLLQRLVAVPGLIAITYPDMFAKATLHKIAAN